MGLELINWATEQILYTFVKNIVLDVVSMMLHEEAEELQDQPEDLDLDCIAV